MERGLGSPDVRAISHHERLANEIMDQLGFDDIPEFLRCLHQELTNRFAAMADDAEKENELRRRRYVAIRDAHEAQPTLAREPR